MNQTEENIQKRSTYKPESYLETPYNRAKDEWNDRMGSLVKSARTGRIMGFTGMLVALVAVIGLIYKSLTSTVQPYYVRVSDNGQPTIVGSMPEEYQPNINEISYFLNEWIQWVRAVPLDPVLVKQNYGKALTRMRQSAANKLNAWAQEAPRLKNVGRETVSVQSLGVVPISGTKSYQARWIEEHRNSEGGLKAKETWTATFNIEIEPPKELKILRANPIGIYIPDFQWQKEQ